MAWIFGDFFPPGSDKGSPGIGFDVIRHPRNVVTNCNNREVIRVRNTKKWRWWNWRVRYIKIEERRRDDRALGDTRSDDAGARQDISEQGAGLTSVEIGRQPAYHSSWQCRLVDEIEQSGVTNGVKSF